MASGSTRAPDPLDALGWDATWEATFDATIGADGAHRGAQPARVVRHDGVAVLAASRSGTTQVPLAQGGDPVVVGDWVAIHEDRVVRVLERRSLLRRRDAIAEAEQPLVANVDEVLIVCGLDRPVKAGRIHRMATLAADAGADAAVLLTKADLHPDTTEPRAIAAAAAPGVRVVAVSALVGQGLDEVRTLARHRTVVLLGESGAGKSTLINALLDEPVALTGDVRRGDAKGRHTTTARELHLLPGGGVLVDTPGIRGVGVWVSSEAVDNAFEDLLELGASCRFSDCAHATEPGCAVQAAAAADPTTAARLRAWRELQAEAEAAEARAADTARRAKRGRGRRGTH